MTSPIPIFNADVPDVQQAAPEAATLRAAQIAAALEDMEQVRTIVSLYLPEFGQPSIRVTTFAALARIEKTLRGLQ